MNSLNVSIIIPTYNYAEYIQEAINSVLKQNYENGKIEIIVVDDGSTDNTCEVLKDMINNGTIQYYCQENKGKAYATYVGIQKSTGKYVFNLDADDYYLENKIINTVNIFEADTSIVHVASPAKYFYQETQATSIEKIPSDILGKTVEGNWLLQYFYSNNILFGGGSTYAARASVLKMIKIPDTVDMFIDEFLILAVLPFGKSHFLEQPLSIWRVHKRNYSGNNLSREKQIQKEQRLLNSSEAVFAYIQENDYDKKLKKIYHLKYLTHKITFYEILKKKTNREVFKYAFEVFFIIRPTWKLLTKYFVVNRLIPSNIFRLLKKVMIIGYISKCICPYDNWITAC